MKVGLRVEDESWVEGGGRMDESCVEGGGKMDEGWVDG